MTLRAAIEQALADGPLTGAQVRERIAPVRSVALHRYLANLRERGHLSARRIGGVWTYALPGHVWPVAPKTVWDWKDAA